VFPVAVAAAAGWLFLFIVLLAVPPSAAPVPLPPDSGDEPPAVLSQLTSKLGELGFRATLIDLAVRGWFQVSTPWGAAGTLGPARSVVPAGSRARRGRRR